MRAFFFGPEHAQLFGALHSPEPGLDRRRGVLLCYPLGFEYIRSHRAFIRLSDRLAAHGFHVMRFDYLGSGDSACEDTDASVSQWLDDLSLALHELRRWTGVDGAYLVGRRFGASLAALGAQHEPEVLGAVLWDPVVTGSRYLENLHAVHDRFLARAHGQSSKSLGERAAATTADAPPELIGNRFSEDLLEEVQRIDLSRVSLRGIPVQIINTGERGDAELLGEALRASGSSVTIENVADPAAWDLRELLAQQIPAPILNTIEDWLNERETCSRP